MGKSRGITLALLLVLLLDIDAFALSGVLTKNFYVPVVKGEYFEADEAAEEPGELEHQENSEEPATPTNVFVIVSEPIQFEVDLTSDEEMTVQKNEEVEEIEAVEEPLLEEEIE